VREGTDYGPSQPSTEDLKALEEGLIEGLEQDSGQDNMRDAISTMVGNPTQDDLGKEGISPTPTSSNPIVTEKSYDSLQASTMENEDRLAPTANTKEPSIWEKHRKAGLRDQDRVTTGYDLRRPARKKQH
jgi:hypothetical protein